MALTYSVEIPNLAQLQQHFAAAPELTRQEAADAVNKSLVVLQATAKAAAPVDTGKLRSGIQISPASPSGEVIQGSVFTDASVPYALWVERGTGLYGPYQTPIVPTTAKALAFELGGVKVVRRSVRGMKGREYMKTAVEQGSAAVAGFFAQAVTNIAQRLGA